MFGQIQQLAPSSQDYVVMSKPPDIGPIQTQLTSVNYNQHQLSELISSGHLIDASMLSSGQSLYSSYLVDQSHGGDALNLTCIATTNSNETDEDAKEYESSVTSDSKTEVILALDCKTATITANDLDDRSFDVEPVNQESSEESETRSAFIQLSEQFTLEMSNRASMKNSVSTNNNIHSNGTNKPLLLLANHLSASELTGQESIQHQQQYYIQPISAQMPCDAGSIDEPIPALQANHPSSHLVDWTNQTTPGSVTVWPTDNLIPVDPSLLFTNPTVTQVDGTVNFCQQDQQQHSAQSILLDPVSTSQANLVVGQQSNPTDSPATSSSFASNRPILLLPPSLLVGSNSIDQQQSSTMTSYIYHQNPAAQESGMQIAYLPSSAQLTTTHDFASNLTSSIVSASHYYGQHVANSKPDIDSSNWFKLPTKVDSPLHEYNQVLREDQYPNCGSIEGDFGADEEGEEEDEDGEDQDFGQEYLAESNNVENIGGERVGQYNATEYNQSVVINEPTTMEIVDFDSDDNEDNRSSGNDVSEGRDPLQSTTDMMGLARMGYNQDPSSTTSANKDQIEPPTSQLYNNPNVLHIQPGDQRQFFNPITSTTFNVYQSNNDDSGNAMQGQEIKDVFVGHLSQSPRPDHPPLAQLSHSQFLHHNQPHLQHHQNATPLSTQHHTYLNEPLGSAHNHQLQNHNLSSSVSQPVFHTPVDCPSYNQRQYQYQQSHQQSSSATNTVVTRRSSQQPRSSAGRPASNDSSLSDSNGGHEEINTKALALQITNELKRYSIPQAVFAHRVLCRSQGTLSDLLRNPKPWSKLKSGRETFRRMANWLQEPEFQRMASLRLAGIEPVMPGKQKAHHHQQLKSAPPTNQFVPAHHPQSSMAPPTYPPDLLHQQVPFPVPSSYPMQSPLPPHSLYMQQPTVLGTVHQSSNDPRHASHQHHNGMTTDSETNNDNITSTDRKSSKKPRLVFTDIQRRTLHAIFDETKRPSKEMQATIAHQLGLELSTVSNFFMNARRRSLDKWQEETTDDATGGNESNSNTPSPQGQPLASRSCALNPVMLQPQSTPIRLATRLQSPPVLSNVNSLLQLNDNNTLRGDAFCTNSQTKWPLFNNSQQHYFSSQDQPTDKGLGGFGAGQLNNGFDSSGQFYANNTGSSFDTVTNHSQQPIAMTLCQQQQYAAQHESNSSTGNFASTIGLGSRFLNTFSSSSTRLLTEQALELCNSLAAASSQKSSSKVTSPPDNSRADSLTQPHNLSTTSTSDCSGRPPNSLVRDVGSWFSARSLFTTNNTVGVGDTLAGNDSQFKPSTLPGPFIDDSTTTTAAIRRFNTPV